MKKLIFVLFLLVGFFIVVFSYVVLLEMVCIGIDIIYVLFLLKDVKGDFVGFDIDFGNEMCKWMQVKCIWVVSDFDVLIFLLKVKKIDVIILLFFIIDKCQQEIVFFDKLYVVDFCLIVVKGLLIQLMLDLLKGKYVGVLQGLIQEVYVNEIWCSKGVDVVVYVNQDLVYFDLVVGCLDVVL